MSMPPKKVGNDGTVFKCPICKTVLTGVEIPTFPFCSDRCRLPALRREPRAGARGEKDRAPAASAQCGGTVGTHRCAAVKQGPSRRRRRRLMLGIGVAVDLDGVQFSLHIRISDLLKLK